MTCAACWSDATVLATWVNQHRVDEHGQAIGQRRVRSFFLREPGAWNALRARMRVHSAVHMTPELFGRLFDAPIARCRCRVAASDECNVRHCAACFAAMEALVEYAAAHLTDSRGERIDAAALRGRIRARPDEWDVLRIGLLPEVAIEYTDCAICLEPIDLPQHLSCGHGFHAACVGRWLRRSRTCPVCRSRQ